MGWLRGLWHYLTAKDPSLNADQRVSRWVNICAAGTILTSLAGGIIGTLFDYPWAGVALGLAVWFAILFAVVTLRTHSHSRTGEVVEDDSLPFPLPRPLPPDWLSRRTLSGLSFRLVDLIAPDQVLNQTNVRDKTFYKCTIHGPAILIPRDTRFEGNNKYVNEPRSEHPQSMLYVYPMTRTQVELGSAAPWQPGTACSAIAHLWTSALCSMSQI
jgi:hypothetical protein